MELAYTGGEEGIQVIENYFVNPKTGEVFRDGVVVECGAAEGFFNPSLTLEQIYKWKYYAFEPDPRMFQVLDRNRPWSIKINKALTDYIGTTPFFMSAHNGNSSIGYNEFHENELKGYKERFDDGTSLHPITVQTIDWQKFVEDYEVNKVNLLTLDVEGHELDVFHGIAKTNILPEVIQVEFIYSDPQNKLFNKEEKKDYSGFFAVANTLMEMGYGFDYVSFNNAHFSLRSFWKGKDRPTKWVEEVDIYEWHDIKFYDKDECKKFII